MGVRRGGRSKGDPIFPGAQNQPLHTVAPALPFPVFDLLQASSLRQPLPWEALARGRMVAQAGQARIRSFCSERLQFGPSSTHLSGCLQTEPGHLCHHRKVRLPALLGPSRASHFCGWLLFCLGARKSILCVVIPRGTHKTLLPGEERERGDTGERHEGLGVGGWLSAPCSLHPALCPSLCPSPGLFFLLCPRAAHLITIFPRTVF